LPTFFDSRQELQTSAVKHFHAPGLMNELYFPLSAV
jgi:hypothetical protein